MGLDLAELVHELELVDPDVAAPVPAGQVLPVGADPDAPDPVPLVVQCVLLPVGPLDGLCLLWKEEGWTIISQLGKLVNLGETINNRFSIYHHLHI